MTKDRQYHGKKREKKEQKTDIGRQNTKRKLDIKQDE